MLYRMVGSGMCVVSYNRFNELFMQMENLSVQGLMASACTAKDSVFSYLLRFSPSLTRSLSISFLFSFRFYAYFSSFFSFLFSIFSLLSFFLFSIFSLVSSLPFLSFLPFLLFLFYILSSSLSFTLNDGGIFQHD